MIRNLKTLGLAVVAVLAMTAVVASSASAANFTASSYPAAGSGGQTTKHVFSVQGQKVECTEASFTGSLAAASEELTITPAYNGCTAFGFIGAKVDMNGCDYLFTAENGVTGKVHVKCPAGKVITITAGGCNVHIAAQTPTTPTVHFENIKTLTEFSPSHRHSEDVVKVTSTAAGIHANVTSSFPCTLSGGASIGTYTGTTIFDSTEGKAIHVA